MSAVGNSYDNNLTERSVRPLVIAREISVVGRAVPMAPRPAWLSSATLGLGLLKISIRSFNA